MNDNSFQPSKEVVIDISRIVNNKTTHNKRIRVPDQIELTDGIGRVLIQRIFKTIKTFRQVKE